MRLTLSQRTPGSTAEAYAPPYCTVRGDATGHGFVPDDFSLWSFDPRLGQGVEIEWGASHGDEALFLVSGALEVDGHRVDAEAAVIVEAGVPACVRATEESRVVHFGPHSTDGPTEGPYGPASEHGRHVHVVGQDDAEHVWPGGEGEPVNVFFSDGTRPTCRLALFMPVSTAQDGYDTISHTHSEDEIIHMLDGAIRVGSDTVEPGMSIAVPANMRYAFRSTAPFRFLNYRRDISTFLGRPGSTPIVEVVSVIRQLASAVD